jgi:prepilin-type N-terminal cleavage/methylation domain-containing protein
LRQSSGFTLIEIIASLALLAILTAVFGLGLVRVMDVFAFNRANVQLAQKAQPAMMRIARELMELTRIPDNQVAGDDPFIIYTRTRADISQLDVRMGIHFHPDDGRIRLYTGLDPTVTTLNGDTINQGHVLIDGVSAFSLQFQGDDSWSIGSDPDRLSTIRINLSLLRPDSPGRTQAFRTLVHLRNTTNMGGAAPTQTPASIDNYSCFIQSIEGSGMGITTPFRGTRLPAPHKNLPFSEIVWDVLCWLGLLVGCSAVILRGRKFSRCQSKKSSHGSALILILVTLLIFSLIAAVILPMVSSSGQQAVAADWSTKAYFLAESGYRYAASRYLNAGPLDSQKNDALEELDGQTYTLINNHTNDGQNDGRFELRVYSYFFEIESITGNNRFVAHCPGSLPPPPNGMTIRNGLKLRIGKEETPFTISGTPVSGEEDDKLTITVDRDLGGITTTDLVRPLVEASGNSAPITNGGNLSYEKDMANMFPLLNGQIEVADRVLTYRYREADQFVDVRDPNDAGMSLDVTDGAPITLVRHVRLHATGRYGSGDLQAVREVIYHNPLPMPSTDTRRVQVTDRFDSGSGHWSSALGQHGIGPAGPDSNSALLVLGTTELGAEYKSSLVQFNPAAAEIDFNAARRATRGYLNYDAQIKIGFQTGDPTRSDYAAGLSFRLSGTADNENMYGISFLRASDVNVGIPPGIIPESEANRLTGKQLIVLWRQTGNGTSREWLAYRDIDLETDEIAIDDTGWTLGGNWQRNEAPPRFEISVNPSATPNQNHDLAYESGMELPDKDRITLSFASHYTSNKSDFDDLSVRICLADNTDCETYPIEKRDNVTLTPMIDLRPFAGKQVRVIFRFSSSNPSHTSWFINNIKIEADWPVEDSTLLVRVIEAATLEFNSGGPDPIEAGDWVQGTTSGARGQVIQSPILSSSNWSGNGAQGILLLNRVTGLFQSTPETLSVIGKASTATTTGFDPDSDKQVNFIRAYYARPAAPGEEELANDNPLDAIKLSSNRLANNQETNLPWPPDQIEDWAPETDYFRLIEWDNVDHEISTPVKLIPDGNSPVGNSSELCGPDESNAIINFHPDLQSRTLSMIEGIIPELGLHSIGDDAAYIYFDDFGLQIDIAPLTVFPLPLQQ